MVHRRLHGRHLSAEAGGDVDGFVRDLADEVGAPVPLVAGRIEAVEGALQRRVGHRLHAVHERLRQCLQQGVPWLFSFLSADRRRTYCLYEAPSAEAIMAAASRAKIPADAVVEVGPAAPELSGRLRDWAHAVPSS
jgi:hypothetical protein